MRLHRLDVTAFGPFAGTESVDFDHLGEAGLFLLAGPTGAGKTSVLDAICFALYGDVPGDRGTAKRLRSDHAAPDAVPRVVLEATVAGRRLRITRSPAWDRPKKRGSGMTRQQAAVVVEEQLDDGWTTQTTRLDEAGQFLGGLLGMTLTQFTQVALLPQGRFQSFLRAGSEERKQLLQQLFSTARFGDVERWLRERRVELRRLSDRHHRQLGEALSRVSESTGRPLPEDWETSDLRLPARAGEIPDWLEALHGDLASQRDEAAAAAEEGTTREAECRRRLELARAREERRRRIIEAWTELGELDDQAEEHAADLAGLDAAQRAASVLPFHEYAAKAVEAERRAIDQATEAGLLDHADLTVPVLNDALAGAQSTAAQATDALASARALLPRDSRRGEILSQLERVEGERAQLRQDRAEVTQQRADLPAELDDLRTRLSAARRAEEQLPEVTARLEAHRRLEQLAPQRLAAETALLEARHRALECREVAYRIRHARLESMAAELAGQLAAGEGCPVCGSEDPPHTAAAAADAPDAVAEKKAQRAVDDAAAEEHARRERLRDLDTEIQVLTARAGEDAQDALDTERAQLADQVAQLADLVDTLAATERTATEIDERLHTLDTRLGTIDGASRELRAEQDRLTSELDVALRNTAATDIAGLTALRETELTRAQHQVGLLRTLLDARRERHETETASSEHAIAARFPDTEAAVAAALDPDELARLRDRVRDHENRRAGLAAVLAEPGSDELRTAAPADLDGLAAAHRDALSALSDARATRDRTGDRLRRLGDLRTEVTGHLTAWDPVRDELDLTDRLAQFAEGKGPDNRWQMSLSSYVVAYRLTQVVAAANERLAVMSGQRYTVEHSATRGAGDRRGGLALLIRDDWSGESRDPATLSGGETFVVSLSLALGLADVITHEAGGVMVETLFVDEGFGSLDADTLEDVLDVLDGLRDGGRVVGVVSHVTEMQSRIPTRLQVTKSHTGSHLTATGDS